MFRNQDSKFVDPSFFVDPLAFEFTGIHNDIRFSFGSNVANQQRQFRERIAREEAEFVANQAAERRARAEAEARRAVTAQRASMRTETARQREIQNTYSQILAETRAQTEAAQARARLTTLATNQRRVLTQQRTIAAAIQQQQQPTTQQDQSQLTIGQQQQRRSLVGQPGISRTRISTGTAVGGFAGTSPGRVNPTGLNI